MDSPRTSHPRSIPSLVLRSAVLLCASVAGAQKPPQLRPVQIDSGKVAGVLTADQQVVAYKGIPYASPPVEDLRWRPPQPVGRWKGVLAARDFGPHCIQFGGSPDMVFHDPGASEDCLTLNVWTPAGAHADKRSPGLPVMVWIYGGGFQTGGTSENRQDGEFLAHRGVIVVSMNYRLGLFGFFAHPELTAESPRQASGNYGLMDQAAALAWVRRNIAAFGGDPANVTLFGQSAGSESVSVQMASPFANGLFAKAIGESGSEFPRPDHILPTREEAEAKNVEWATRAFGSARLFYLRSLGADELTQAAAARSNPPPPHFGPIIDGSFLPDTLPHLYAEGRQAHIPLLGGSVANEALPAAIPTAEQFRAQAQAEFGADAGRFLALYPALTDADAAQSARDYASDRYLGYVTWAWQNAQTKTGDAPVYRYFFDLPSPGDRNHTVAMGAFHADDIEYVFGTLDSRPEMKIRPEDRALSELMQQYWTNFAKSKTGDPNGPGLPRWPAYTSNGDWQVMHLDATPHVTTDPLRPRYLLLKSLWSNTAAQ